jgi:hypothetical protein
MKYTPVPPACTTSIPFLLARSMKVAITKLTSSEILFPMFATVTATVTFSPGLMVDGEIIRSEYRKVVYELRTYTQNFQNNQNVN